MNRAFRFVATAATAFLLYLLLTMSASPAEVLLGVFVAIVTASIVIRYLPFSFQMFNPIRIIRAIVYAPIFIWKMILANIHIAGIVIRPRLMIHPAIVKANTQLATPVGKLMLTSSITLTPGTLSVDLKNGDVYVHVVDSTGIAVEEARERIVVPFENHIKGISE